MIHHRLHQESAGPPFRCALKRWRTLMRGASGLVLNKQAAHEAWIRKTSNASLDGSVLARESAPTVRMIGRIPREIQTGRRGDGHSFPVVSTCYHDASQIRDGRQPTVSSKSTIDKSDRAHAEERRATRFDAFEK